MNTSGGLLTEKNSASVAIDEAILAIPGENDMVEVRQFAFREPGNGTFIYQAGMIGQTYPGFLAVKNLIPSNPFGLHYGSASLGAVGSLT